MKTIPVFGARGLILILSAALGLGLGFVSAAFAQTFPQAVIVNPDGKVTYLGTPGRTFTEVHDINDSGQVIGNNGGLDGNFNAFITGPDGMGMTDLGTTGGISIRAFGINDAGQVAGWFSGGFSGDRPHAFITGPDGKGITALDTLGTFSAASAINESGQVAGNFETVEGPTHAFITDPNGKRMTDLGTLGGNESFASGINDSGQVVGLSGSKELDQFGNRANHAFITGANGMGMTDLGTLGGANSAADGINDAGRVVGGSNTAEGSTHAFITGANGIGMIDLGMLGGTNSYASGINDSGQVVGDSDTKESGPNEEGAVRHAFITGPNGAGMIDINSYADLPNGFYLNHAIGINNLGQVLATVVPEPASYALMLAGLGLVGFMARWKKPAGSSVARG